MFLSGTPVDKLNRFRHPACRCTTRGWGVNLTGPLFIAMLIFLLRWEFWFKRCYTRSILRIKLISNHFNKIKCKAIKCLRSKDSYSNFTVRWTSLRSKRPFNQKFFWNASRSRVDVGFSHRPCMLKTLFRNLCFEETVWVLPDLVTNDGLLRSILPTSGLRIGFMGKLCK